MKEGEKVKKKMVTSGKSLKLDIKLDALIEAVGEYELQVVYVNKVDFIDNKGTLIETKPIVLKAEKKYFRIIKKPVVVYESNYDFSISLTGKEVYLKKAPVAFNIVFKNKGSKIIRLPKYPKPYHKYFSIDIKPKTKNKSKVEVMPLDPIALFSPDADEYVDLESKKELIYPIDLEDRDLKPGIYEINVSYGRSLSLIKNNEMKVSKKSFGGVTS